VRLLYVSSILPYKHPWHVLSAVERVRRSTGKDVQINLVGAGDRQGMKRLVREVRRLGHPSWVHQRGWVHHDDLPSLYREADIFVFASSCETISNVLLEAMASGLPIACANRRPMTDTLKDGGVYFEPEAPDSIAGALSRLIQDSKFRQEQAWRAYEYSQLYSWARCARETFDFLRRVVSSVRASC
jgi:glycosyltransferase involved in cell wall biosynthesis